MKSINTLYDEWVLRHQEEMVGTIRGLKSVFKENKCHFGGDVLPTFLKPAFISKHEEDNIKKVVYFLTRMLEKSVSAYFDHPELRPLYTLPKKIQPFIEMDPGYKNSIVISRPDAFVNHGVYRFIEFNCDSPAGAGYTDVQESIFKKTPIMSGLSGKFKWKQSKRLKTLLGSLLKCYSEYGGRKKHPQIAIIDWRTVKTRPEFEIIKDYFEKNGYRTVIADPRELKLKSGHLYVKDFRVDLIYRRVIVNELLDKKNDVKDLLRAYAHGKVCMVNSLRSRLAASKSTLSILTNPAYNFLYDAEEIKVRDKHVPWTRLVTDVKKFYGGKSIYLTEMIDEHQKDLVLKPASGYGGRDVKIGHEVSRSEWRRTLQHAMKGYEPWVVQEYVPIPQMTVPIVKGKRVVLESKKINVNPYVFGGNYAGTLARLSNANVINVSRGGGLIPSITYERK